MVDLAQKLVRRLRPLASRASAAYWRLAPHPPLDRVHTRMVRLRNRLRYGVDTVHMFRVVEIEINSMCNRKCPYCPNSFASRPSGFMSRELFDRIIAELSEIGFDGRISYHFYGEPLLDRRLPDLVSYTKEHLPDATPEIVSNGDFLDLERFRDYLRRGLDHFLITQHDNAMPRNLQSLVDAITDDEREHITIRFARDRKMINRSGLIERFGRPDGSLAVPCDWALTSMVVTFEGNVVLCCNDYFEKEVMGNVASGSLRDVWTGARFTALREALSRGDRTQSELCRPCDYVPEGVKRERIVPVRRGLLARIL
jgi:2-deoxy-scyllo-inosamine dehydrogenase (SAM-dependent)/8-amino-3,8-dideoxy-alpha-D-manno-octulosonate transaminase